MSRVIGNLYAFTSMAPCVESVRDCTFMACLPLDVTSDGLVADNPRYCNILTIPLGMRMDEVLLVLEQCRPISYHWLSYVWEV